MLLIFFVGRLESGGHLLEGGSLLAGCDGLYCTFPALRSCLALCETRRNERLSQSTQFSSPHAL